MSFEPIAPQTPLEAPKKNNTTLIIVIVVVVILLCCCCSLAGGLWVYGDQIMSALNSV